MREDVYEVICERADIKRVCIIITLIVLTIDDHFSIS